MSQFLNVIGMPLNEAKKIYQKEGYIVRVLTTGPFQSENQEEHLRVVRCRAYIDTMVLTVVLEKYE